MSTWNPVAFRGDDVIGPRSVHCLVVIHDSDNGKLTTREVATALGFGTFEFQSKYGAICAALNKLYHKGMLEVELVPRGVYFWKHKSGKRVKTTRKVCEWKLTAKGEKEAAALAPAVHALLKSKLGLGVIRGHKLS